MKKYEVEWNGAENGKIITHHIVADSLNNAFDQAVEKYKCPAHPEMYVVWIWVLVRNASTIPTLPLTMLIQKSQM